MLRLKIRCTGGLYDPIQETEYRGLTRTVLIRAYMQLLACMRNCLDTADAKWSLEFGTFPA